MKKELKELPRELLVVNVLATLATYLVLALTFILKVGLQLGAGWDGLLFGGIILFLFCPIASIAVFAFLLFIEHRALSGKTVDFRDLWYYRMPKEGTIGNPTLDDLIGRKGNIVVIIVLVAVVVFVFFELYCSLGKS